MKSSETKKFQIGNRVRRREDGRVGTVADPSRALGKKAEHSDEWVLNIDNVCDLDRHFKTYAMITVITDDNRIMWGSPGKFEIAGPVQKVFDFMEAR